MESKEAITAKLSTQEKEKLEKNIEYALDTSQKKGRLDLIVFPNARNVAALYIIRNKRGDRTYFASVVPRKLVYVEEAADQRLPEIYVNSDFLSTEIIAASIRGFLHDHYQKIENLPITLYSSKKDFLERKSLTEIEIFPENNKAA